MDNDLTGDFNEAAPKDPRSAILEAVTNTRRDLALTDAVRRKDWESATELVKAGANPLQRNAVALQTLIDCGAPEAIPLVEKMDLPEGRGLESLPYIMGAHNGDLAKTEEGLQKGQPAEARSSMLFAALRKGHDAVADRILQDLPEKDMQENALFALLLHRPEIYESAVANREKAPDYLGHFYNACLLKEPEAMETSLQKMMDNRTTLPFYIFMDDLDGMGYARMMDYTEAVLKTNNLPVIEKFLGTFSDIITPGKQAVISTACRFEKEQPGLLKSVIDALRPSPYQISFAVTNTVSNPETAKFLMDAYPKDVVQNSHGVLLALAQEKGDTLQKAVEEDGLPLSSDDKARAALLAAAIFADNKEGEKWLLQKCEITPELIEGLQDNHNYNVIKRSFQLGGEMRFKNDALFWKAVLQDDRAVIDAYPRKPKLSTETGWLALNAVSKTIEKGDFALLRDILENTDWDKNLQKRLFRDCLGSAPAMQAALEAGIAPPKKLEINDTLRISKGDGEKSLAWIKANTDITLDDELARSALDSAVHHNATGMIEYLLAQGTELASSPSFLSYAITENAEDAALQTLEKWITRGQAQPAPGLEEDISSGKPLFGFAESPAIRAAYAGRFSEIIKKTALEKNFDPAVLVSTTDTHGNTVLDILGAQGRLNDIFAVPALWKDGDAVSFIRDNSSPLYHDQCDFAGLKASIDLLRLQDKGRRDRFKLK